MNRAAKLTAGLLVGALVGALGVCGVVRWASGRPRPAATLAPEERAQPGPEGAAASGEIRTEAVTVYQRAKTQELRLVAVPGQVTWFDAPSDRARQVVQLVLDGVPGESPGVPPAPSGIRAANVLVAASGTAWVDLDGTTLGALAGADEELALVAALSRSLTEAVPEIKQVGFLVDGKPRTTLAGHVDLGRTFTGREWPAGDGEGEGGTGGGEQGAGSADGNAAAGEPGAAAGEPGTAPPAEPVEGT